MEARDVVKECQRYSDTVAFFYVFSKGLVDSGVKVEIEQDRRSPTGARRVPDFLVIDGSKITDVVEHKGSLTDPEHTLEEFNEVAKKYSRIEGNDGVEEPRVTLLYPLHQKRVVDAVRVRIDSSLNLCGFDQTSKETEVSFALSGNVHSSGVDRVLRGPPLQYDPAIVRSTYKYIRSDPPVAYVASEVWRILPTFKGVKEADLRIYDVSRDLLLERMRQFYPPWIRELQQINSARVDGALLFLNSAGFVQWKPGNRIIRVNSTRGSRSGDHLETFAREFVKHIERRAGRRPMGVAKGQRTLDQFPSGPRKAP